MPAIGLSVSATVDTSVLDAMVAGLPSKMESVLAEVCSKIEAEAKAGAPVDTGALRNSIMLEREDDLIYIVHDGVEYGVFNELGTRYMAARPFFVPAVEGNASLLASKLPEVLR